MSIWFLIQTRPNADAIARRNLERQRFVTFQPLERRTRVQKGRFVAERRPFFPGYLFATYPEAAAPWSVINSTYGVVRLVSFAGKPAIVPKSVIRDLREACDEDEVIAFGQDIAEGTEVEIASGSFAGLVGEVLSLTPNNRVLVLLDFLGRQTRVNLPAGAVRRAPGSRTAKGAGR
ncbi:MAG: transcription termination/antitermination protein NusG [Erythrobacter sp.]